VGFEFAESGGPPADARQNSRRSALRAARLLHSDERFVVAPDVISCPGIRLDLVALNWEVLQLEPCV